MPLAFWGYLKGRLGTRAIVTFVPVTTHRRWGTDNMVDSLSFATSEVHVHSITGAPNDYDRLFDLVGDRRMVLIGGA